MKDEFSFGIWNQALFMRSAGEKGVHSVSSEGVLYLNEKTLIPSPLRYIAEAKLTVQYPPCQTLSRPSAVVVRTKGATAHKLYALRTWYLRKPIGIFGDSAAHPSVGQKHLFIIPVPTEKNIAEVSVS